MASRFHNRKLNLIIVFVIVGLTGCRTFGDVNYVSASNADKAGDHAKAFKLYTAVANDPGYPDKAAAQFRLARMYLEGEGVPQNPQKALELFQVVTKSDDKSWRNLALYDLGSIYQQGIPGILEKDRIEAAKWYSLSAKAGHEVSQDAYTRISRHPEVYVAGRRDIFSTPASATAPAGMARAYKLFENSEQRAALEIFLWHARNGNAEAQWNSGVIYKNGLGTEVDVSKYTAWVYLAGTNGNAQAQLELGNLYRNGEHVPGSDSEAEQWLIKSAQQENSEAYNHLGVIALHPFDDGVDSKPKKAFDYFHKAAKLGNGFALTNLGDMYFEGNGTEQNPARAKDLYIQAAQNGIMEARTKLFENFSIVFNPEEKEKSQPSVDRKRAVDKPPVQTAKKATARVPQTEKIQLSPVELFASLSPSVFRVFASTGKDSISQGSAIALTEYVAVTNCHVVAANAHIARKVNDKLVFFDRPVGNRQKDICFITSKEKLRPVSATRNYSDLKVGEKVFAIGSPQGLQNSFSEGLISGLRTRQGVSVIQTSAAISGGSSGGALFDAQGRLIGITTFKVTTGESLNFAIAIDEALKLMPSRTAHAR